MHAVYEAELEVLDGKITSINEQLEGEEGYYAMRDLAQSAYEQDCAEKFTLEEELARRTDYTYAPFDISNFDPFYTDWSLLKGWTMPVLEERPPCKVQNIVDYKKALD